MSTEPAFVDSNVLVYAHMERSAFHGPSSALVARAQARELALLVAPQVLSELYAVITDPRRVTDPYSPEEALEAIEKLLAVPGVAVVGMPGDVVGRWIGLARRHSVTRGEIFDVQLAATLLGNGLRRIYTYNRTHFECFPEIEVLTP